MLRRASASVCLLAAASAAPAWAQAPGEVADLDWCPSAQDCLAWSAVPAAAGYNVYSGRAQDLPGLLDAGTDACSVGSFATTTTGAVLGSPPAGALDWFLVTAFNPMGEGPAGAGSSGPRLVDSSGPCVFAGGAVLNEVDYDQDGSDTAEFVEVYNGGPGDLDLAGVVLILVNGLTSTEYDRVALSDAGPTLPAGAFLVVGSSTVVAALPAGTLSVTFSASSNNIQNGAPDGLALFDTTSGTLLDALSYEGPITAAQLDGEPGTYDLVEGIAATAQDSNSTDGSLVRFPDGADTDQADSDWHFVATVTPGSANAAP